MIEDSDYYWDNCWHCRAEMSLPGDYRFCGPECEAAYKTYLAALSLEDRQLRGIDPPSEDVDA